MFIRMSSFIPDPSLVCLHIFGHMQSALSSDQLLRIQTSRDQYTSFVRRMAQSDYAGGDVWQLQDQLASELCDEVMEETVGEVMHLCDALVERLVSAEFSSGSQQ